MLFGARGPRDLLIRDVANERVPEGELVLSVHRRDSNGTDELATYELVQVTPHVIAAAGADGRDGAAPEYPSDHGGIVEERLQLGTKRVEPGSHERLHRLGHGEPLDVAALDEHPRELLCVERVSTGALEERALRLGGKERALEKEPGGVGRPPRSTAARARSSSRSAFLRPSPVDARRARGARCRGGEAARACSSPGGARGTREAHRQPNGCPRRRGRMDAERPPPRGTYAMR